jgi:hypothetical protein
MPMSPRLLRPRQAGGFDPRTISGLMAWWDAQVSSSYDIVTGVSEWRDLSGNGNTVSQAITNNQPSLSTINGKTAFSFDGTNDDLAASSPMLPVTHTGEFSTFAAYQMPSGGVSDVGYFWSNGISGRGFGLLALSTDVVFRYGVADTSPLFSSGTRANDVPQVVGFTHNNRVGRFSLDGVLGSAVTTGSTTLAATSNMLIGNRPGNTGSSAFFPGKLGSILIYSRALSVAERQAVERWLGQRWGITVA